MFHIFFTLSCADRRYPENFTCLLQDHNISYRYEAGCQVVLIDGKSIEEFLDEHSSMHEHIRTNILTATLNYNYRVKAFIKQIVMNTMSDLKVNHYSYRVEFQLRVSDEEQRINWFDFYTDLILFVGCCSYPWCLVFGH